MRKVGLLALSIVAALVLVWVWSLWDGGVHAPDGGPARPTPSRAALPANEADGVANRAQQEKVDAERLEPEDAEPAKDEIKFIGRIVYAPPCPYERIQTLEQLKPTIEVMVLDGDDFRPYADSEPPIDPDGAFAHTVSLPSDEDYRKDYLRLLNPGCTYRLRVVTDGAIESEGWIDVQPKIEGRVVDFGDVAVELGHLLRGSPWLIAGRLVDPVGAPLAYADSLSFHCFGAFPPIHGSANSDKNGWFVEILDRESEWPSSASMEQWFLDLRGSPDVATDDNWGFEDALIPLQVPRVDEKRRLIEFGDISVPGSFLDVSLALSEDAARIIDAAPDGQFLVANVRLENGDSDYNLSVRHDQPRRVTLLPGRYVGRATFSRATWDDNGHTIWVYSDEIVWDYASEWLEFSFELDLPSKTSKALLLPVKRAREVRVTVETAEGALAAANLSNTTATTSEDGELQLIAGYVHESYPLPAIIRLSPGEHRTLTASAPGYEPVTAAIPAEGAAMVIRLGPRLAPVPVTVRFSGEEPADFPEVLVAAVRGGSWEKRGDIEPMRAQPGNASAGPLTFMLLPARWTIHAFLDAQGQIGAELAFCWVDVEATVPAEVCLPTLRLPTLPERIARVRCGQSEIQAGTANVKLENGDLRPASSLHEWGVLGVCDGAEFHARTKVDGQYELELPVRVRLALPDGLIRMLPNGWEREMYVGCRQLNSGNQISGRAKRVNTLWAPSGECEVFLGHRGASLSQSWIVNVEPGKVVDLTASDDVSMVRLVIESAPEAAQQQRRRAHVPDWGLYRESGEEVWLDRFGPVPASDELDWYVLLPAGEYVLGVSGGRQNKFPIRFTVTTGSEQTIHVPAPDPIFCDGSLLLSLPQGVFGMCDTDVRWCTLDKDTRKVPDGDYISFWIHSRVVDGRLRVDGLPVGENIVVYVELNCGDSKRTQVWTTRVETAALADSKPRAVDAHWAAVETSED